MEIKIIRQIDKLGRLVIPADLRIQYGLKAGNKIRFTPYDNGILIHSENCDCNDDNKEK